MAVNGKEDLGELAERKYNDGVKNAGGQLLQGMSRLSGSSFVKGALITAGVVLVGAALLFGFSADTGIFKTFFTSSRGAVSWVPRGFGAGVGDGLSLAFKFLTHGWGIATLAAGGVAKTLIDSKQQQNTVAAYQAGQLAKEYELSRERQRQREQTPETRETSVADRIPPDGHAAKELRRREQNMNNNHLQAG